MKIIPCDYEVTRCPNCGKQVSKNIARDWDSEYYTCFFGEEVDENSVLIDYYVICHNDED